MPPDDPDLDLVQQLQAGNDSALDELMARHQQRIYRFIWRYIPNAHDALELAQETFVRAYFNIAKFSPKTQFSSWLFTIALNLCRDHSRSKAYRQARQQHAWPEPAHDESAGTMEFKAATPGPAEQLQQKEKLQALNTAITELSADLKAPFILAALEGHSYQSCAQQLGISVKAVEMKLYRARKILAEKIKNF